MLFARLRRCTLISAVIFLLVSCQEEFATVGQSAPEIAAFDLEGNKVELKDWKGKTLLLSFWSETCGICISELKQLENMAQAYPGKVHLLAINIDGDKFNTQAVVTKRALTLPVLKDQMHITAERYRLIGTPTSFVIDPEGKIRYKFEGLIPHDDLLKLFTQG